MTLDQVLAFSLIGVTVAAFVWDRLPYDLIALTALAAGIALGLVPADKAFSGFSDDIVIIVGSALVLSTAIARSGAVETLMRPILPHLTSAQRQVWTLVAGVLLLSMVTKNVGALAIFMPIALQLARRTGTSPSTLLMPMAFASLIGGIVTLVGTSPNVIVSKVRADLTGQPFGMFDYAPVGLCVAATGFLFLCLGWRLLPRRESGARAMDAAFNLERYTTEANLPAGHPGIGGTIAELEAASDGDVRIATVLRERFRRYPASPDFRLRANDVLLLTGEPDALERFIARTDLMLAGTLPEAEAVVMEGVVTAESGLVGRTAAQLDLERRQGVLILAVSRRGRRIEQRLSAVRFRAGDVVVMRGRTAALGPSLGALGVLPLAAREIALGRNDRSWIPAAILAVAMGLVALHVVPVTVAFFGAVVAVLLLRSMTPHEAYQAVEWPVLVLLGALIPISETVTSTGRGGPHRRPSDDAGSGSAADCGDEHDPGAGDGRDPFPQQRRHGPGDGSDRRQAGDEARAGAGPLPHGRRARRGLRFPHADRSPVQHPRHGTGGISLRGLRAARIAALADRHRRGRSDDRAGLAAAAGLTTSPQARGETLGPLLKAPQGRPGPSPARRTARVPRSGGHIPPR